MSDYQFAARERLALQIRELRKEKQYSQEGLAEACGLNRTYIGAIERAEHNIGIDNIEKLAAGLGVPIIRLVCSDDPDAQGDPAVPMVKTTRFLAMVDRCARERPDLLIDCLERYGVYISAGRESAGDLRRCN